MDALTVTLAKTVLQGCVQLRNWLIVGGVVVAGLGVALAVLSATRSEPGSATARPTVVVRLEPTDADGPTIVQPIILDSGGGSGAGIWVSLLAAFGGLMGGAGTLAAVWAKADTGGRESVASSPDAAG